MTGLAVSVWLGAPGPKEGLDRGLADSGARILGTWDVGERQSKSREKAS